MSIPDRPLGFAPDVWRAAEAFIAHAGLSAPALAEIRGSNDFLTADDRRYFDEIAQACDFILALNQLPPPGWRSHTAPFDDRREPTGD